MEGVYDFFFDRCPQPPGVKVSLVVCRQNNASRAVRQFLDLKPATRERYVALEVQMLFNDFKFQDLAWLDATDAFNQPAAVILAAHNLSHTVLTAITVLHAGIQQSAIDVSQVTFRRLDAAEIADYWETGEPIDKAGGYALQGRAAAFVSRIEGSYSGIVGLPLYHVAEVLKKVEIKGK